MLSVSAQCELLGLSRSSYYYEPATESVENLALMALLDKEYTDHPFRGSRGMRSWLRQNGHKVNRKRVQRLMRLMGLEAVYPKPRLSVGGAGHKVYQAVSVTGIRRVQGLGVALAVETENDAEPGTALL